MSQPIATELLILSFLTDITPHPINSPPGDAVDRAVAEQQ